MSASEEQLVLEALNDSHQAFEQLIEQYQYRVLRTIVSIISDEQAAQDVAQETFLSAWSDLPKLKGKHKFGGWVNQIAINLSKHWLRDKWKYRKYTASFMDMTSLAQEQRYQSEKLRHEIWEAIDELAEDYREAVILHYISGYSYREISEMLSVPVSTVSGRLQKAKAQLRKEFLDMVTQLQLEIDSTVHKFLKERAKQDGVSIEGLILRLIQRYKRDIDKPEVAVRQVWEPSHEPVISDACGAPSPDGRYLSFIDWWGQCNLAVRDLTTGECHDLTDEGTWEGPDRRAGHSVWSPDGVQIAYGWWNEDHWELRIVELDGSEPRVLYCDETIRGFHGVAPFTWSQDGKHILTTFYRTPSLDEEVWEISLVSVADGSVRVLRSLKDLRHERRWYYMSLSPDGRQVAYARHVKEHKGARDIFLLTTDGSGEEVPLVEHPADDYGPVWAPDGKGIVFASDRSGVYDVWLMQVADGKPVGEPQLIKRDTGPIRPMGFTGEGSFYYSLPADLADVYTATIDPVTGELLEPPTKAIRQFEGRNLSPAWSPDGKSLAYVSMRPPPGNLRRTGTLVIRSMETGEERELHPEARLENLSWSPDGRSILCGRSLQIIDAQTGDVIPSCSPIPLIEVNVDGAAWSHDGESVFYIRMARSGRQPLNRIIVTHHLETGKEGELYQGDIWPGLAISPDGQWLVFAGVRTLEAMSVMGGEPRVFHRLQDTENFDLYAMGCASGIAWTADGRYVLFAIRNLGQFWATGGVACLLCGGKTSEAAGNGWIERHKRSSRWATYGFHRRSDSDG